MTIVLFKANISVTIYAPTRVVHDMPVNPVYFNISDRLINFFFLAIKLDQI